MARSDIQKFILFLCTPYYEICTLPPRYLLMYFLNRKFIFTEQGLIGFTSGLGVEHVTRIQYILTAELLKHLISKRNARKVFHGTDQIICWHWSWSACVAAYNFSLFCDEQNFIVRSSDDSIVLGWVFFSINRITHEPLHLMKFCTNMYLDNL